MISKKTKRDLHKHLSRAKHFCLSKVKRNNVKVCTACGERVSGFAFYSYRPCHCPFCHSSPRVRFVHYALDEGLIPDLSFDRVLHVAPGEQRLARYLREASRSYVGGDIEPDRYEGEVVRLDLTAMAFKEPFSLIYASHVLEHIPDDRLAMKNLYENLVPGGVALILVPLLGEVTEEGGPHLSAEERLRRFGQYDHVRQYGMDIVGRLAEAGFEVEVLDAGDCGAAVMSRHGFETHGYKGDPETDRIFVCRRPAGSSA